MADRSRSRPRRPRAAAPPLLSLLAALLAAAAVATAAPATAPAARRPQLTFSAPQPLGPPGARSAIFRRGALLHAGEDGSMVAFWASLDMPYVSVRPAGGHFTPPRRLPIAITRHGSWAMPPAVAPGGGTLFAWEVADENRDANGHDFGFARVAPNGRAAGQPNVRLGGWGGLLLGHWRNARGDQLALLLHHQDGATVLSSAGGGPLGAPETLPWSVGPTGLTAELSASSNGALVAWKGRQSCAEEPAATCQAIVVAQRPPGADRFGAPRVLTAIPPLARDRDAMLSRPRIHALPGDRFLVSWQRNAPSVGVNAVEVAAGTFAGGIGAPVAVGGSETGSVPASCRGAGSRAAIRNADDVWVAGVVPGAAGAVRLVLSRKLDGCTRRTLEATLGGDVVSPATPSSLPDGPDFPSVVASATTAAALSQTPGGLVLALSHGGRPFGRPLDLGAMGVRYAESHVEGSRVTTLLRLGCGSHRGAQTVALLQRPGRPFRIVPVWRCGRQPQFAFDGDGRLVALLQTPNALTARVSCRLWAPDATSPRCATGRP